MAGKSEPQEKLNRTLGYILKKLNDSEITEWFISYGTLLGIIRNGSCIPHDDDVDIIINCKDKSKLKNILVESGFTFTHTSFPNIIKTAATNKYASMDFYCAVVNDEGDFDDVHEGVVWTKCRDVSGNLPNMIWRDNNVNIPNNHIKKLLTRYGSDCMDKVKRKGQGGNGFRVHKYL